MGPANLAAIKRAVEKLERLDPDYAERVKRNRRNMSRARKTAINRQFDAALKHLLARNVDRIDPDDDTTNVDEQDDTLLVLAANDHAKALKKEKPNCEARLYTSGSKTLTLTQWAETTGICKGTLQSRLYAGHSPETALCRAYLPRSQGAAPRVLVAKRHEANGESKTIFEWSKVTGINEGTIRTRIKAGWPFSQAISVPAGSMMGRGTHKRMMSTGGRPEHSIEGAGTGGIGPLDIASKQGF